MSAPAVFCDRLDWRSALALARARPPVVNVLDPVDARWTTAMARRFLGLLGCTVNEPEFFAGHMHEDGEPLIILAIKQASQLALDTARSTVAAHRELAAIDAGIGTDRLALRMARQSWLALNRQVLQIRIAAALAGPGTPAVLYLSRAPGYDGTGLAAIAPGTELRYYKGHGAVRERLRLMAWLAVPLVKPGISRVLGMFSGSARRLVDPAGRPGVLLLQEDEVSADRSYRTQPHWLPPGQTQPFATYLLAGGAWPAPARASLPQGVLLLTEADLGRIDRSAPGDAVSSELTTSAFRCFCRALCARREEVASAYAIAARLLARARLFAKACRFLGVRTFVTGEPYLFDSDAVHACAAGLGMKTVAFQYSNLAFGNVIAAATADDMVLFSPAYAPIWSYCGVRPGRFTPGGYLFDGAFDLVRARAASWRAQLRGAGARFVICFFDENIGPPKYGFMAAEDLDEEVWALARCVIENEDMAVIFKSQFRKRSPTVRMGEDALLARALATGRMIDLCTGAHRNIVFPAEAALASDFAISHVNGATAALESALAGTRCLLINFNGMKTTLDHLYARGRIVFSSMGEALRAILAYRKDEAAGRELGDWSGFLHELDPFRDGRAADRLREVVTRATVNGESAR